MTAVLHDYALYALTLIVAGILWVWRKVILHDKTLELMQKDITHSREHRSGQDEIIKEIRRDQKEILAAITDLRISNAQNHVNPHS